MQIKPTTQRRYIIRKNLLKLFSEEGFKPGDKLPSERVMMSTLGVSRLSLREALHLLEEERFVRAIQGMGWYLMAKPVLFEEDISQLKSVTEMFKSSGLNLFTEVLSFQTYNLLENWDEMELGQGEEILMVERIRYSEKDPYFYTIDYIPTKYLKGKPRKEEFAGSLLKTLEEKYNIKVEYSHAKISVVEKKDFESEHPLLQKISSWLLLEQINYNEKGVPQIYSRDYHRSDKLHFFVRRYVNNSG